VTEKAESAVTTAKNKSKGTIERVGLQAAFTRNIMAGHNIKRVKGHYRQRIAASGHGTTAGA